MNSHISIPFEVRFFSEMFKLPSLGKFISKIKSNTKDQYAFVNYALIGIKEAIIKNQIKVDENDIKEFSKIRKLLSFVSSAINETDSVNLSAIKENVIESVATIDEIQVIIEEKIAYKTLKQNLYNASEFAITSHLEKYSKAV